MKTSQNVFFGDARSITFIGDRSIDLIVTSPPYPMIGMWDSAFAAMNPAIGEELEAGNGRAAFELMHRELDQVWRECFRVLKDGSIACINIGDAVRTMNGEFRMYPNHARIIAAAAEAGFSSLPDILWRKPTNSPTKFMGSGMLPAGAYVTYEHEYVLVFRKGARRSFKSAPEKQNRWESAFFWEERNKWFSDVWTDVTGIDQNLDDKETRTRSAAFPFELAFRLITMHSVYGDTVFDPFAGTGTSLAATTAAGRNGVGVEIDHALSPRIEEVIEGALLTGGERVKNRLFDHTEFIRARRESGLTVGHVNGPYGFPVMSRQEKDIRFYLPYRVKRIGPGRFEIDYTVADMENSSKPAAFFAISSRSANGTLW